MNIFEIITLRLLYNTTLNLETVQFKKFQRINRMYKHRIFIQSLFSTAAILDSWGYVLNQGCNFTLKFFFYQTGTFSSAKLVLIIHRSWQTLSGLNSCSRDLQPEVFCDWEVTRLHAGSRRVYSLPFVSFCKQRLTGFDLTGRHKWWHYFNNQPWSQWLSSWASTIIGVMCGLCPSGLAASLNGWRRVTGCRGDELLMREPD